MSNEDQTLWIVFNGEIYDFQKVRRELIGRGHIFKSESDTEVILHLYEERGPDCVRLLRGMFAFAIWDESQQVLFAARDRLGKKPLYYASMPQKFYFSSEIGPLFQVPNLDKRLDLEALDLYMTYTYIPSPFSIVKGVKKLPPAHYLVFRKGKIEIQRYWDLNYAPKLKVPFRDAQQILKDKLLEATRIRLRSDVPLGCLLSGGVDSSLILAQMAELSSSPIKTFSIGFSEKQYDETPYARQAADRFGTEHHEFTVKPSSVEIIGNLVNHYGEPFGDASALPTWYLSELTRKYVTVALTGDGGDELFAGYNWHATAMKLCSLSHLFPSGLAAAFLFTKNKMNGNSSLAHKVARLLGLLAENDAHRFASLRVQLTGSYKSMIYSKSFLGQLTRNSEDYLLRLYENHPLWGDLDRMLYVDTASYLPEELLVKVDRAMMAHSLEGRSPFLDHELVELVAQMPSSFKYVRGENKRILRELGKGSFPQKFMDRPKSGFSVPLKAWFSGDLESYARHHLVTGTLKETGLFDMNGIERIIDQNKSGLRDHGDLIWRLLMLSKWFELFA